MLALTSFHFVLFALVVSFVMALGIVSLLITSLKIAMPGTALLRNGHGGRIVGFDRVIAIPFLHRVDKIDISARKLTFDRRDSNPIIFRDGTSARVTFDVFVAVNKEVYDLLASVDQFGVEALNDEEAFAKLVSPKIHDAIESTAAKVSFAECFEDRDSFREQFLLTCDLRPLVTQEIAIHHLEKLS